MSDTDHFKDLICRVRSGDPEAAAELVRRFEPQIRLEVRVRLRVRNRNLRRTFDSMDICQSVLASFFVRAAAGQYDLEEPEQLLHLLVAMAHNKLAEQVRFQQRERRDVRRAQSVGPEHMELAGRSESPSQLAAGGPAQATGPRRGSRREGIGVGGSPAALAQKVGPARRAEPAHTLPFPCSLSGLIPHGNK
jgi:hypothetical protein